MRRRAPIRPRFRRRLQRASFFKSVNIVENPGQSRLWWYPDICSGREAAAETTPVAVLAASLGAPTGEKVESAGRPGRRTKYWTPRLACFERASGIAPRLLLVRNKGGVKYGTQSVKQHIPRCCGSCCKSVCSALTSTKFTYSLRGRRLNYHCPPCNVERRRLEASGLCRGGPGSNVRARMVAAAAQIVRLLRDAGPLCCGPERLQDWNQQGEPYSIHLDDH